MGERFAHQSAAIVHADPVKVLVVDDSAAMRKWLTFVMEQDARLKVVGEAEDAKTARALIKALDPDVLTLDLVMPEMNGLEFLSHLMRLRPMPVIVFSGLVASQGNVAAAAKKLGAYACIPKPSQPNSASLATLCDTLVAAGQSRTDTPIASPVLPDRIILIGASTGGVSAIEDVLPQFSTNGPPIVIAQHMPQRFLESFVDRLNRSFALDVSLARPDVELTPGTVHLAPALDSQTCVRRKHGGWFVEFHPRTDEDIFCPSVNRLFFSAEPWAEQVGAMILTGLGDDGADGLLALFKAGARTVGQSKDSCAVYGMPGSARALGAVEKEVGVRSVGKTLINMMAEKQ